MAPHRAEHQKNHIATTRTRCLDTSRSPLEQVGVGQPFASLQLAAQHRLDACTLDVRCMSIKGSVVACMACRRHERP